MKDIVIKGGLVVDGTGGSPYKTDIRITNGTIAEIALNINPDNAVIIDASGLTVTPGFIDLHTHNDLLVMEQPHRYNAISQGVTTEVVGLCGLGVVPLCGKELTDTIKLYSGILGYYSGDKKNLASFDSYLTAVNGSATNIAAIVTHSAVRAAVMGYENRVATNDEKKQMGKIISDCLDEGAIGFSTGLTYYPAGYSDTSEVIELCKVVKEKNAVFFPHKRDNYTEPRNIGDEEIVKIVKQTGVKLHLLHHRTGLDNAGKTEQLLQPYKELIDSGYDISFELYPYAVGAGFAKVFLPPWVMEGGYDNAIKRLSDMGLREQIANDMKERYGYLMPLTGAVINVLKNTKEYEGLTFASVAKMRNQDEISMVLDLLLLNEFEFGYYYDLDDNVDCSAVDTDFLDLLLMPFYTVGSDSINYGPKPHPRSTGSFTKLLRLAREREFPLEGLIHKITGYPAKRFSLNNKGLIAVGMDADLAIFDYSKVTDNATFKETTRLSTGIVHVLVKGKFAILNEKSTNGCYGKSIRRRNEGL